MLDQDQSQRMVGSNTKGHVPLVAFQVTAKDVSESIVKVDGGLNAVNYNKRTRHVCSQCGMVVHSKDRCYKIHGYPPGWSGKKKTFPSNPVSVQKPTTTSAPSANMTSLQNIDHTLIKPFDQLGANMTKEHIQ